MVALGAAARGGGGGGGGGGGSAGSGPPEDTDEDGDAQDAAAAQRAEQRADGLAELAFAALTDNQVDKLYVQIVSVMAVPTPT